MMSFIHLEDAAAATVLALDAEGPAIYNVTDDEPAPMRDWLPALAAAVGAKPPYHVPAWAGSLLMGKTLGDADPGQGRVQHERQEGTRMDAPLSQLARRLPRLLRPVALAARAAIRPPCPSPVRWSRSSADGRQGLTSRRESLPIAEAHGGENELRRATGRRTHVQAPGNDRSTTRESESRRSKPKSFGMIASCIFCSRSAIFCTLCLM